MEQAFRRDSVLCASYNHDIAGGKWNGMMTQKHIGYRSWNDDFGPHDVMPEVRRLAVKEGANIFTERNGMVAMEAEHYYQREDAAEAAWRVIPFMGRTLSGLSVYPYDKSVGGASLTYRFDTSSEVKGALIVVKSTLDFLNKGGLCYRVTLDDGEPQTINFNAQLNENPQNIYSIYYPTVARRVVETKVPVTAPAGKHTLRIEPLDPGIVFEKVVIDCGGYRPSYLHGDESPRHQE